MMRVDDESNQLSVERGCGRNAVQHQVPQNLQMQVLVEYLTGFGGGVGSRLSSSEGEEGVAIDQRGFAETD